MGYGEKSANRDSAQSSFETYANVRPVREWPNVRTPYSGRGVDLVVVRENVEDLYGGVEHMQTPGVAQTLKLITRKGSRRSPASPSSSPAPRGASGCIAPPRPTS